MKTFLHRLLEAVGLVTIGRHKVVVDRLKAAEATSRRLSTQLDETRADSRGWKLKTDEALKEAKTLSGELGRWKHRADKLEGDLRAVRQVTQSRLGELESLQERVAHAERELMLAREHLMAVEVKLDILEGAATVLDDRTRVVLADRAPRTGVPV